MSKVSLELKKVTEANFDLSTPHDMIASLIGDYIVTLYDIDNFSVLPGYAQNFYALNFEAGDDETEQTLKQVLIDIRDMGLGMAPTIDHDLAVIGLEDLDDYLPILQKFEDRVMKTVFDKEKSQQQPLPLKETLIHSIRNSDDPFILSLVSNDRHFDSESDLSDNMIENFQLVAGMGDYYTPPTYSIALIKRAIATHKYPTIGSTNNFWFH